MDVNQAPVWYVQVIVRNAVLLSSTINTLYNVIVIHAS
jgi:hypothetical protein